MAVDGEMLFTLVSISFVKLNDIYSSRKAGWHCLGSLSLDKVSLLIILRTHAGYELIDSYTEVRSAELVITSYIQQARVEKLFLLKMDTGAVFSKLTEYWGLTSYGVASEGKWQEYWGLTCYGVASQGKLHEYWELTCYGVASRGKWQEY